jgi:hypothetical protein
MGGLVIIRFLRRRNRHRAKKAADAERLLKGLPAMALSSLVDPNKNMLPIKEEQNAESEGSSAQGGAAS